MYFEKFHVSDFLQNALADIPILSENASECPSGVIADGECNPSASQVSEKQGHNSQVRTPDWHSEVEDT